MFVKCEIRIILPKLFQPIVIKQATGIYSLPQLLHQLWCLGKSAQLRSDWEFGLLHLVRLLYTLSKVIHPKYYKRIADFINFERASILLLLVVHNVQLQRSFHVKFFIAIKVRQLSILVLKCSFLNQQAKADTYVFKLLESEYIFNVYSLWDI